MNFQSLKNAKSIIGIYFLVILGRQPNNLFMNQKLQHTLRCNLSTTKISPPYKMQYMISDKIFVSGVGSAPNIIKRFIHHKELEKEQKKKNIYQQSMPVQSFRLGLVANSNFHLAIINIAEIAYVINEENSRIYNIRKHTDCLINKKKA